MNMLKTAPLFLALSLFTAPLAAQATALEDMPLQDFLNAVSGEYAATDGTSLDCPDTLVVEHTQPDTLRFEGTAAAHELRGLLQYIDGPEHSGGPHWDEIIETRVRRHNAAVISERRTCRDSFFFGVDCTRWAVHGATAVFEDNGFMMVLRPTLDWFTANPSDERVSCRYVRVR